MASTSLRNEFAPRMPRPVGQWLIVGLLGVIAIVLVVMAASMSVPAMAQSASGVDAGTAGVVAVAGQIGRDAYGLYLVDTWRGSVMLYEYNPAQRRLRLTAARTIVFDRNLESYNTDPLPSEVADMVRQARRIPENEPRQ